MEYRSELEKLIPQYIRMTESLRYVIKLWKLGDSRVFLTLLSSVSFHYMLKLSPDGIWPAESTPKYINFAQINVILK